MADRSRPVQARPSGRLPSGTTLPDAIAAVDDATGGYPAYFMINCAHPTHFQHVLDGQWTRRIGGLRANASAKSHAELDAATSLDNGDPVTLGAQYRDLRRLLPRATVLGGCCGTDHRHVQMRQQPGRIVAADSVTSLRLAAKRCAGGAASGGDSS